MGVYIKGMRMPENCSECPVALSGKYCRINKTNETYRMLPFRPDHCPLVDLGKHGDLIDRDALRAEFPEPNDMTDQHQVLVHITGIWAMIDCADTVIEAEE